MRERLERPEVTPAWFAERARRIAGNRTAPEAMRQIIELALDVVACQYASVTLVGPDGSVETAISSDPLVDEADRLQYELSEGPCLTAAEDGGVHLVPNTATDDRWPNWGPRVAALDLHSILAVHLFTAKDTLGALNLYAGPAHQYTEQDIESAQIVAAHASVGLARSRSERNLWAAIDSRHLIGQAQGVLIERYHIDADAAFSVLKRHSQQLNVKLRDVAAELLRTGELPGSGVVGSPSRSAADVPG